MFGWSRTVDVGLRQEFAQHLPDAGAADVVARRLLELLHGRLALSRHLAVQPPQQLHMAGAATRRSQ